MKAAFSKCDAHPSIIQLLNVTVQARPVSHPICIKCSSKAEVASFHSVHQGGSVGQVGLGGSTAKVLQRDAVDSGVRWGSQFFTEDPAHVGTHHCETTRAEDGAMGASADISGGSRGSAGPVMNCLTSTHGVYVYLELIRSCEETLDGTEIKDASQQLQIHLNRVDDLNWKHMKGRR